MLCILPEQPARESLTQYGLPQTVGAGEVGLDGGFEFLDDGQAALDFGHDLSLFDERWERDRNCF